MTIADQVYHDYHDDLIALKNICRKNCTWKKCFDYNPNMVKFIFADKSNIIIDVNRELAGIGKNDCWCFQNSSEYHHFSEDYLRKIEQELNTELEQYDFFDQDNELTNIEINEHGYCHFYIVDSESSFDWYGWWSNLMDLLKNMYHYSRDDFVRYFQSDENWDAEIEWELGL